MPVPTNVQPRFACVPCRQHKRKCGREWPACKLCRKVKRPCEYSASSLSAPKTASAKHSLISPSPTSDGSGEVSQSRADYDGPDQQNLTAAYFLDASAYKYNSKATPRPVISLPESHYDLVGGVESAQSIVDHHFKTGHRWLPIVSPIRIRRQLVDPLPADVVCLILTMRLLNRPYCHTQSESLYATCKSSIAFLEAQTISSINVVLANVLLASYEVGHAMYPAAALSVAHCARLADVSGVNYNANDPYLLPKPQTQSELEERRRTLWAIAMLDRFILIGIPKHQPVTPDPNPDDLLPTTEDFFEAGGLAWPSPILTQNTTSPTASPFARACQAIHLLSCVIRHLEQPSGDLDSHFMQALQLRRTLMPLAELISSESASACPPHSPDITSALALVHSTMTMLDGMYICSQMEGVAWLRNYNTAAMQADALESIHWSANRIHAIASRLAWIEDVRSVDGVISPFVVAALYSGALIYQWLAKEGDENEAPGRYRTIVGVLEMISARWSSARVYLNILSDTDASV